ncbi:MAG: [Fe-Fe] hydrogenase large subunit C-terminal domain-containing protein [Acidobacteriota bacterium]
MQAYYHSIRFDAARCDGCMSCMRVCPTRAVRIRKGGAVMLEDRCIDCGECIRSCTRGAVVPLTGTLEDLSSFTYKVAIPSPALYAQFDPEVTPGMILDALKICGFDDAVSLSASCDAVAAATELFLDEYRGQYPLISSFCPSVVRLIQVQYPDLVEQLLPILTPREIAAREAKVKKEVDSGIDTERIGAVYITPCPAKMVSIVDHPGMDRSYLDSAVSIRDLYQILAAALAQSQERKDRAGDGETASGIAWAYLGALPMSVPAENSMSVAGLPNVIRILDDIEKGRLRRYSFVECHACPEGCVSGPLTIENPYVARARAIRLSGSLERAEAARSEQILRLYREGAFLMKQTIGARPHKPLDTDISRAIAKMKEKDRIRAGLPGIDCGACGAPTCEAFAEDLVEGETEAASCVFVRQQQVSELVERLGVLLKIHSGSGERPSVGVQQ